MSSKKGRYFSKKHRNEGDDYSYSAKMNDGIDGRGNRGGRGRGQRHPPHLKGKEIGLFYARLNKNKRETSNDKSSKKTKLQAIPSLMMDQNIEIQLSELLRKFQRTENSISLPVNVENFSKNQPSKSTSSNNTFSISHANQKVFNTDQNAQEDVNMYDGDDLPLFPELEMNEFLLEYKNHLAADEAPTFQLGKECLVRDKNLDLSFKAQMEQKQTFSEAYKQMLTFRQKLPSYNMQKQIVDLINENRVIVICGETGCGKTTQVAQFILDDQILRGQGSICNIVCTQPRRISAITVAERVAEERGEKIGSESVGYQIRLESKLPRLRGSILFCTTGIILQYLQSDSKLTGISHILVDEIHERSLHSDFLLIILKEIITQRSDLKVVLMSATINADQFSQYYGNCPIITIPGFTYPVKEYLLEDVIELTRFMPSNIPNFQPWKKRQKATREDKEYEENLKVFARNSVGRYSNKTLSILQMFLDTALLTFDIILHLVKHIVLHFEEGAILIFLPGWDDIKKMNDAFSKDVMFSPSKFRILPLHSLMPTINQKEIFNRPPSGMRKIIIATNIAETSITIEDVVFVIDSGKIKMKKFDIDKKLQTLNPEWVSLANAHQRRGRAGRVQNGYCFHLYTKVREDMLDQYQLPEMLRTPLEELCLQIKILKLGKIIPFVTKALESPSIAAIYDAIKNLMELNALNLQENLTPLGFHLARMPVEPHIGKMMLFGAMFSCLNPILTIASCLSFKDPFMIPLGKEAAADKTRRLMSQGSKSDHMTIVYAFENWCKALKGKNVSSFCWDNFLSPNILKMLANMKRQLGEVLYKLGFLKSKNIAEFNANRNSDNTRVINAIICAGLYPNVAKMTNPNVPHPRFMTKLDGTVCLHPKSVNAQEKQFESPFLIYYEKIKSSRIYLHDCTMIMPYTLLFFGRDFTITKDRVNIDSWLKVHIPNRTAQLIKQLRNEMNKLLDYKISHPCATDWNTRTREGAILDIVVELLTEEKFPQYVSIPQTVDEHNITDETSETVEHNIINEPSSSNYTSSSRK